jgi:hypothetical protein
MTIEGRTVIKKAFLSGTTRRIQFQIVDKELGTGFQPDTFTMSVYDVEHQTTTTWGRPWWRCWHCTSIISTTTVSSTIVNAQNDVDVSAFCDASGNVDIYLTVDDTAIDVPNILSAIHHQRVVTFTWTWDSPVKTGKHEIVLNIAPDRETVAA